MLLFIMPVMFLFFARSFPAGLALYWVYYSFLSAIQTFYINYKLGIGLFAPEETKEKSNITKAAELYDKQQEEKRRLENPEEAKKEDEERKKKEKELKAQQERDKKLPDKPWQTK